MKGILGLRRIYMDHASTTPLDKGVFRAMVNVYKNHYFNPGALYREGVSAASIVHESRTSVAKLIGTTSDHVVFTRGGTESCNMAIAGVLAASSVAVPHVITAAIEHAAVLETLKDMERLNKISLSVISVDHEGIISMDELKKALRPETVLVSVMYVNNEIGTIQPVREITKLIRWHKKNLSRFPAETTLPSTRGGASYPLVHTDAIQAANYLDINVERLGIDLMSLSGSKIYGPKSCGALYVRDRKLVGSFFHGGDQEFGLRAGTEDVAQIVGFAKALELTLKVSHSESVRLAELQKHFLSEATKTISDVIINGARDDRVPNNINITIPGISGERLVIELDAKGICAASKSACKEDNGEASHVIAAIRKPHPNPLLKGEGAAPSVTDGALRLTLGRSTTKSDIEKTAKVLAGIVLKIRAFEENLQKYD